MRTGRSLTVFRSLQQPGGGGCTWSGGMYLVPGGWVPGPGGVPDPRGVYLVPGGCTWSGGVGGYLVRGVYLILGGVPGRGGVPGPGGVYLVPGVYLILGGCTWSLGGVPGPGGVYLVRYSPTVNRMTNRCKNITLAKTSFRLVIRASMFELLLVKYALSLFVGI